MGEEGAEEGAEEGEGRGGTTSPSLTQRARRAGGWLPEPAERLITQGATPCTFIPHPISKGRGVLFLPWFNYFPQLSNQSACSFLTHLLLRRKQGTSVLLDGQALLSQGAPGAKGEVSAEVYGTEGY